MLDMAGRFNNIESRLDHLEAKVGRRFGDQDLKRNPTYAKLDASLDRFHKNLDSKITRCFAWMIGLTLTGWLSVMIKMSR